MVFQEATGLYIPIAAVAESPPGTGWLGNLPSGWTLAGEVDFAASSIPSSDGAIGGGNWQTLGIAGNGAWSKETNNWLLTKPPGHYGTPTAGYFWGDLYLPDLGGAFRSKWYICIEQKFSSSSGDYEWHPVSNKWLEQGWNTGSPWQLLVQLYETDGSWQAPEQLYTAPDGWHPGNSIDNSAVPSDVQTIFEMQVEYDTPLLKTWRDGTLRSSYATSDMGADQASGWQETYVRNFDGGGEMDRARTSYIRFYRLAVYYDAAS